MGVLDHHQNGAAPLAANADTLEQPEQRQQYWSRDSYLLIGRKAADQECARSHDHHRERQHRFTTDAVSEMAEDRSADRPRDESHGIGTERGDRPDDGIEG